MDNKQKILEIALTLFATKGFDAVGVQEIVDLCGITKPTLYHYFGSKVGLLQAIIQEHQSTFESALADAAEYQNDLSLSLEKICRTFFSFAKQHKNYYHLLLTLNLSAPEGESHKVVIKPMQTMETKIERLFVDATKNHGNIRGKEQTAATVFLGSINAFITLWINGRSDLNEVEIQALIRQFQYGIYS